MAKNRPFSSTPILIAAILWFAAALAAGASHILARIPMPFPQVIMLVLTALLVAASRWSQGFRGWLDRLNPRWLAAIHVTRFIGGYFLVLYSRGKLPFAFAVPGGTGDMIVAAGALVMLSLPPERSPYRTVWQIWNAVGLADILFVVVTAARLGMAAPGSMAAIAELPLSLLPTFLVPLIIGSHIELFGNLRRLPPIDSQAESH